MFQKPVPRSPKVSQSQLAKELGISQALVSLVLNGRRHLIDPETYKRVWAHAVKRGYHPKGMRPAASPSPLIQQVGFVLRAPFRLHTQSLYFGHIQQGLHAALAKQGATTVFLGAEDLLDEKTLGRFYQIGHHFRGVVLLGAVSRSFLLLLRQFEKRIVAVSAEYPGLCHSVTGNEAQALELLVRHLHELGHQRIGWLGGNAGLGRHEARFLPFEAALKARSLPLDRRYCVALQQADRAEGAEAALAMLRHGQRRDFPTAFICYNTLMAAGAVRAFERGGLRVPGELSVASADVSPVAIMGNARITAAGCNPEKLGEAAARLILADTESDDGTFINLILPAELRIGDTTGPAQ